MPEKVPECHPSSDLITDIDSDDDSAAEIREKTLQNDAYLRKLHGEKLDTGTEATDNVAKVQDIVSEINCQPHRHNLNNENISPATIHSDANSDQMTYHSKAKIVNPSHSDGVPSDAKIDADGNLYVMKETRSPFGGSYKVKKILSRPGIAEQTSHRPDNNLSAKSEWESASSSEKRPEIKPEVQPFVDKLAIPAKGPLHNAQPELRDSRTVKVESKLEMRPKIETGDTPVGGITVDSIIDITGAAYAIPSTDASFGNFRQDVFEPEIRLGDRFKDKLRLSDSDVRILNSFYYYGNTFTEIEFCYLRLVELFLKLLQALDEFYKQRGSSNFEKFEAFTHLVVVKCYHFRKGSVNYQYAHGESYRDLYLFLMKNAENSLRERYGVKRKVNSSPMYSVKEVSKAYIETIEVPVSEVLPDLMEDVTMPDYETEIKLNAQNTTRWKIAFDRGVAQYKSSDMFIAEIDKLGKMNKENPSIENIYYEASKFISKRDKVASLRYYITYIYYDLISSKVNNKLLTKTVQKSLFASDDQVNRFISVVNELVLERDLDKALSACNDFYTVKRRRIVLDRDTIRKVISEDSKATELLSVLLDDQEASNSVTARDKGNGEIAMKVELKGSSPVASSYRTDICFDSIQTLVLNLFKKDNFEVPVDELEDFARAHNHFGGQLVESLNETCFDVLDDVLIEQQEGVYTIDSEYFKIIQDVE